MTKNTLKVGDKVCIAKLPDPDENEALYGTHATITEMSTRSVLVDFVVWTKDTGVKQDVPVTQKWIPFDSVYVDKATARRPFEPTRVTEFVSKAEKRKR